jgi:hypothetical protein
MDATAGEVSASKVRVQEEGAVGIRPAEVAELCLDLLDETRPGEVRLPQVRQPKIRLVEFRAAEGASLRSAPPRTPGHLKSDQ